jgi:hypothetical protein
LVLFFKKEHSFFLLNLLLSAIMASDLLEPTMPARLLLLTAMLVPGAAMAAPPASSEDFLQTIGVVTHMAYTDGEYADVPLVISSLNYLGITAVRDGISDGYDPITGQYNGSAPISTYFTLAAAGVKFNFLTFGGGAITMSILNTQLGLMQQVVANTPGSVVAIEGPNEINNQPVTWNGAPDATCPEELSDALALQKAIYKAVHANKAFRHTTTVMLTGANAYLTADSCELADHPNIGTVHGYAAYDNQHPYPPNGNAPNYYVNPANNVPGNTAPLVYTETAYSSSGGTYAGVNQYVQEMYGLDLFFDAAYYGVTRTYWYDLLDAYAPGSPQGDDSFGLFDYLQNPKPIAIALHNLRAIMTDTGRKTLMTPAFTASGLPASSYTLALGRRDGSSGDYVVWAEPVLWNPANGTQVSTTPASVTISLGKTYTTVSVYDATQGIDPVQTAKAASQIVVTVVDHPVIVRAR